MEIAERQTVLKKEYVGSDTIKISFADDVDSNRILGELQKCFDDLLHEKVDRIVLDMEKVGFPSGSFIATVIGMTVEARRWGGDVKIINLPETAKNHFAIFTPLTYLSIGSADETAVGGFVEDILPSYDDLSELEDKKPVSFEVMASIDSLNRVTDFVTSLAQKAGMERIEVSKLKIAVYEACMNVIEHGYHFEPGQFLGIEVMKEKERFQVTISDRGESFDFYNLKSYDVEEAFNKKRRGGFGLYIIQRSVDEICYESDPKKGNRLTLIKKISRG